MDMKMVLKASWMSPPSSNETKATRRGQRPAAMNRWTTSSATA
jgi:hypothetical protein